MFLLVPEEKLLPVHSEGPFLCAICVGGEAQTGFLFHLTGSDGWWEQQSCHQPDWGVWRLASGYALRKLLEALILLPAAWTCPDPWTCQTGPHHLRIKAGSCLEPSSSRWKWVSHAAKRAQTHSYSLSPTGGNQAHEDPAAGRPGPRRLGRPQPRQSENHLLCFRNQSAETLQ